MLVAAESEREGIDVGQYLWRQDQHAELWDWAHDPQHHRLGQDGRLLNTARGKFIANVEVNRRVVRVLPSLFGAAHHTVHNWTCERKKTFVTLFKHASAAMPLSRRFAPTSVERARAGGEWRHPHAFLDQESLQLSATLDNRVVA